MYMGREKEGHGLFVGGIVGEGGLCLGGRGVTPGLRIPEQVYSNIQ